MRRALRLLCGLLLLLGLAAPAAAHTKSETHSSWQITGPLVRLTFTAPEVEIRRLSKDGAPVSDAAAGAYIGDRVGALNHGEPCRRLSGPTPASAQPLYRRYEFVFRCLDGQPVQIRSSAFIDLVPTHVNFAQVQTDKGAFIEQLLTKDRQTLDLSDSAGRPPRPNSLSRVMTSSMPPSPPARTAGRRVATAKFSAPIRAMVRATRASMYSAWGRRTPVTARARVQEWPMVKPVTTNSRSFNRREISTRPTRKAW